jgi:hypothetical protein
MYSPQRSFALHNAESTQPCKSPLTYFYWNGKCKTGTPLIEIIFSPNASSVCFNDTFGDKQSYINLLTLPVNNFLKDLSQIERDFEAELKKNNEYCVCLNGKMIPANEVLSMPMEENY